MTVYNADYKRQTHRFIFWRRIAFFSYKCGGKQRFSPASLFIRLVKHKSGLEYPTKGKIIVLSFRAI